MPKYIYQGIRPHVREACVGTDAVSDRVEQFGPIKRLNDLLCQVIGHHNGGTPEHVPATLEVCRPIIRELEAAVVAAKSAFDEVSAACQSGPTPDETPADDRPTFNIPAEGEAGQEAATGDSQYGNPEDVIDHMDPPPEDDPPLGRKGRKR